MKLFNKVIRVLSLAIAFAFCLFPAAVYAQNNVGATSTRMHHIQQATHFLAAATTDTLFPGEKGTSLLEKLDIEFSPKDLLNYDDARDLLYSSIDSKDNVLTCIYTGFQIELNPSIDPTVDADNKGINAEHVWPQSRGAESVKSDLHNIYPSRMDVNSARGNRPFDDIPDRQVSKWFRGNGERTVIPTQFIDEFSELTSSEFEPREDAKGNVARAMFYFQTVYKDKGEGGFFENQQDHLCQWHKEDPANATEIARSHAIANSGQGNENPFILDPTLAERAYCTEKLNQGRALIFWGIADQTLFGHAFLVSGGQCPP